MNFCLSSLNCFSFSSSSSESFSNHSEQDSQTLRNLHAFLYDELKIATDGFRSSNKIGEGGFGSVYKGRLKDGRTVAVKVLSVESKQGDREFMSEIVSLSNISHANLVKLLGGCIDGPSRILVYEYMENNSLAQVLLGGEKIRANLSWKSRKEIALGIAQALAYIHEEVKPHIVHRDIKLSNILLDQNFTPKISDFGLSRLFSENVTHLSTGVAGTLGYLAPEYAVSGHLTRKSDVYSFGVLLLEIVSGRTAIDFDVELGEFFLVEKAWEMYKSNQLLQLVDPVLKGSISSGQEVVHFLKVGLLCVQEKCGLRPYMSKAFKMMCDGIDMDDLQISKPGLITSIMDVKIGNRRSSSPSFTRMLSPQLQTR
ncbi:putative serine/threonine-protein kinase isoform X1 [Herrania umbratica]|uniref:Serine/threonine-protein kinase isoform X1 n=1 Tax=Herrania umbratica TaxID=108875 RepID=A0A6J1BBQ8_9ROSI|nr:putative serine/threonine-protein kinase isoform X1 [Herrania umbratica]